MKIAVAFTELLPNVAEVPCPNPSCGNIRTSKFMYFNNGNVGQPRYKCGACNTSFTNGGRRSPNMNRSAQAVDIPGKPTHQMLDKMSIDLLPNADSPTIMELMELIEISEAGAESFLDETNWHELQDINSTSFLKMMQSREVVEHASEQTSNEINLPELQDIDCSNVIEMMQLLDLPEEGREQISEKDNPVQHLLNIDSPSTMNKRESLDAQKRRMIKDQRKSNWLRYQISIA